MQYFEMNFRGNLRPTPTSHNYEIIENNSMLLHKTNEIEYRIIGFHSDHIFKQINALLDKKQVPQEEGKKSINIIDKAKFKFKNSIVRINNIKMIGESNYCSDVLKFCKPRKGDFYWHYGRNFYDNGHRVGVEEPQRMWLIIKTVLNEPKYCLIYEKSNVKLNARNKDS
jgi:hypothetical protein